MTLNADRRAAIKANAARLVAAAGRELHLVTDRDVRQAIDIAIQIETFADERFALIGTPPGPIAVSAAA